MFGKKPEYASCEIEMAARIGRKGPMTVADFMEMAGSSYYASQSPFGRAGDFITAPEVSQIFGEMLALWIVDIWLQIGQPKKVQLIELGPGNGTLMEDMMRTIETWPACRGAVSVHLVETSPRLRRQQEGLLRKYKPKWYSKLEDVPDGFSFIVANEFFDALPVHQFIRKGGRWQERYVGFDPRKNEFIWMLGESAFDIRTVIPKKFMDSKEGSIFESSPVSLSVMEEIGRRVKKNNGAALIIDYGHTTPGLGDTLQAVSKQRYASVLEKPGLQDITAHVDFETLKSIVENTVEIHGPTTQGKFLEKIGIMQRAETLYKNATGQQKRDIDAAHHRLTAPTEMGNLFKAMALTRKGQELHVAGF